MSVQLLLQLPAALVEAQKVEAAPQLGLTSLLSLPDMSPSDNFKRLPFEGKV